jgi:hypothetical protein
MESLIYRASIDQSQKENPNQDLVWPAISFTNSPRKHQIGLKEGSMSPFNCSQPKDTLNADPDIVGPGVESMI